MNQTNITSWTLIAGAAAGNHADGERFSHRYIPIVRAYLAARWKNGPCAGDIDDATQEVFIEFFKKGGILEQIASVCQGGFRPYLYGVVRNVARHFETRRSRDRLRTTPEDFDLNSVPDEEESMSRLFGRTWAQSLMREAAQRLAELATQAGLEAEKRVELLRLRFQDNLPIRDIAQRWQMDPAKVHHEYARARQEFKSALLDIVAFHRPGSPEEIAQECAELVSYLGNS